jgi:hypothetical protein
MSIHIAPIPLPPGVIDLFEDPLVQKTLATVDADGVPHIEVPHALLLSDDGHIHYLELLESSATNRNLVRSIWFDAKLAIVLAATDGRVVQIKGTPVKVHITGALFQQHYQAVRAQLGDVDLAGVWVIRLDEIIDQSFKAASAREAALHPDFIHLDRLAAH